jgi:hypothetical protein
MKMADKIEKPVLDTKPDDKKPDDKVDAAQTEDLIKALQQAGVTTTDQLDGKLQASQQYGHMQNKLGDLRTENDKLIETIQNLSAQKTPAQGPTSFDDVSDGGQQVDLQALVANTVEGVLDKRDKQAAQMQNANLQKYHKITTDRNYNKVKAIWEEKLKDPQFMFEINNGVKDPVDAYRDIVDEFKDGLLKQSLDTITALTGSGRVPASPHIEGDARVTHNLPADASESQEIINKVQEKVDKGGQLTEQEQLAALNATLGGT